MSAPRCAEPWVFHVDIDAFFASVEQLRDPRLAGRPVAVGSGVIASASYEARSFGLSAGMPLQEARRRCPALVVIEGHYPVYRCFAERVFDLCREYSPAIENHLDEAFCDLSGTERLYRWRCPGGAGGAGEPPQAMRELKERIRGEVGLSVSVGLGQNRMLAKMASKSVKPGGLRFVAPGEEDGFLRPLPVRLLPGVGPRTAGVLEKLNIRTIEEMRVLSRESLRAMFGQNGLLLQERSWGKDTRVVSAREIPRSISRETSFHRETAEREEIEGMLHYLAERAAGTLRKLGLKTRRVEVKIRHADFQEAAAGRTFRGGASPPRTFPSGSRTFPSRSRTFPSRSPRGDVTPRGDGGAPTQLDGEIFEMALGLYRQLHTRRVALRLVGVTLSNFVPDDGTYPLDLDLWSGGDDPLAAVEAAAARRRRDLSLCRSLDRIRERFGYSAVVCGKSLHLLGKLPQDAYGYVLRTPSLTR